MQLSPKVPGELNMFASMSAAMATTLYRSLLLLHLLSCTDVPRCLLSPGMVEELESRPWGHYLGKRKC